MNLPTATNFSDNELPCLQPGTAPSPPAPATPPLHAVTLLLMHATARQQPTTTLPAHTPCCPPLQVLKTLNPSIKIVVMLRDPVKRALSRFIEQQRNQNFPLHPEVRCVRHVRRSGAWPRAASCAAAACTTLPACPHHAPPVHHPVTMKGRKQRRALRAQGASDAQNAAARFVSP